MEHVYKQLLLQLYLLSEPLDGPDVCEVIKNRLQRVDTPFHFSRYDSEVVKDNKRMRLFFYQTAYALYALYLVLSLHACFISGEGQSNPEILELGVKDRRKVSTLIEILFAWGVYPNISRDLCSSLKNATGFYLHSSPPTDDVLSVNVLSIFTSAICYILFSNSEISKCLRTNHLHRIITALIQLKQKSKDSSISGISAFISLWDSFYISPDGVSLSQFINDIMKFWDCAKSLEHLLNKSNPHNILTTLFSLVRAKNVPWFTSECSRYLTSFLLRKDGVQIVIGSLLPKEIKELRLNQLTSISDLIITVPKNMNASDYYDLISEQVFEIMNRKENNVEKALAIALIIVLVTKFPDLGYEKMLKPMFFRLELINLPRDRLSKYETGERDLDGRCIVASEEYINNALKMFQSLLRGTNIRQQFIQHLARFIPQLYKIYEFEKKSLCSTCSQWLDVLTSIIRNCSDDVINSAFRTIIVDHPVSASVIVTRGSCGWSQLVVNDEVEDHVEIIQESENRESSNSAGVSFDLNTLLRFISSLGVDTLQGNLFLYLLNLVEDISEDNCKAKVNILDVVLQLMKEYSHKLLKKALQILEFSKSILHSKKPEMVIMGLNIICIMVSSQELSSQTRFTLLEIMEQLKILSDSTNEEISTSARETRAILNMCNNLNTKHKPVTNSLEILEDALKDLCHELLPVRAHGMSNIKKLVIQRDEVIKDRLPIILASVLEQLRNEDSFLYLHAVKVLCALSTSYPNLLLKRLAKEYTRKTEDVPFRLKIGEVLLQVTREYGDALPKYIELYIMEIFENIQDEDKYITASALSLISIVSKQCPYTLRNYTYRIIDETSNILTTRKEEEVRRGAISVLCSLATYSENEKLDSYSANVLKRTRSILHRLAKYDTDEIVKTSSRNALSRMRLSFIGI